MITTDPIVIRHATDADEHTLRDLAGLDSRTPLTGPALIAEVDGIARAAVDLSDGSNAADPFAPTAELVELLHLRAATLVAVNPPTRLRARVSSLRHPRAAGARI
ncbi:MAG: hypothetical protein ACRDKY_05835 [Solirubrobacteraceae bacterium]